MPHGIEIRHGQASLMFMGQSPWHGLGTQPSKPATAAEAITASRLDWEVIKAPLHVVVAWAGCQMQDQFALD
jgi:hypothetical protein